MEIETNLRLKALTEIGYTSLQQCGVPIGVIEALLSVRDTSEEISSMTKRTTTVFTSS